MGAYNLMKITLREERKTIFRRQYKNFESQVMHFELINCPAGKENCFMKLVQMFRISGYGS